jgi:hypothetical protein
VASKELRKKRALREDLSLIGKRIGRACSSELNEEGFMVNMYVRSE